MYCVSYEMCIAYRMMCIAYRMMCIAYRMRCVLRIVWCVLMVSLKPLKQLISILHQRFPDWCNTIVIVIMTIFFALSLFISSNCNWLLLGCFTHSQCCQSNANARNNKHVHFELSLKNILLVPMGDSNYVFSGKSACHYKLHLNPHWFTSPVSTPKSYETLIS